MLQLIVGYILTYSQRLWFALTVIACSISPSLLCQELEIVDKLSLKTAVSAALEKNPQITAVKWRIEEEKGILWQARSLEKPEIFTEYEGVKGSGLTNYENRKLGISQSFEFPTNIYFRSNAQSNIVQSTGAVYRAAVLDISASVRIAYYRAWLSGEVVGLTKKNMELSQEFLTKAEIRFKSGESTRLEYLTAKTEKGKAESRLAKAENERAAAYTELNALMGYDKGHEWLLTDSLIFSNFFHQEFDLEQLLSRTGNHPLSQSADFEARSAQSLMRLSYGSFLPDISFGAYRQKFGDVQSKFWGFNLSASFPLWFFLDQKGKIQQARARFQIAEQEKIKTKIFLNTEVKSAWIDYKNARQQLILHRDQLLPQAQETYQAARTSYDSGEAGYLQLLEAQKLLIETRAEYLESLFAIYSATANLERVTGITLQP